MPAGGALSMAVIKVGHIVEALTQCLQCMRPLCERGKDSITEQTSHPRATEQPVFRANCPSSKAHRLAKKPSAAPDFFFCSGMFLRRPLLSPPACLWPSYPALFPQPFHRPVIKLLLILAFLESACQAYCVYAHNRSVVRCFISFYCVSSQSHFSLQQLYYLATQSNYCTIIGAVLNLAGSPSLPWQPSPL